MHRRPLGPFSSSSIPWPESLGNLLWACSSLLFSKEFVSVACPSCEASYLPDQVSVCQFQAGEALFAHGGRGLLCPNKHGLYVITEWNS